MQATERERSIAKDWSETEKDIGLTTRYCTLTYQRSYNEDALQGDKRLENMVKDALLKWDEHGMFEEVEVDGGFSFAQGDDNTSIQNLEIDPKRIHSTSSINLRIILKGKLHLLFKLFRVQLQDSDRFSFTEKSKKYGMQYMLPIGYLQGIMVSYANPGYYERQLKKLLPNVDFEIRSKRVTMNKFRGKFFLFMLRNALQNFLFTLLNIM